MERTKPNKMKRTKNENTTLNIFLRVQIFAIIIYITIFILGAFLALAIDIPQKYDYIFSVALFLISSFITGFFAGMKIRENGLLVGSLYALPMNIVTLLISVIMNSFNISFNLLITAIMLILFSGIGGIFAVNKRLRR